MLLRTLVCEEFWGFEYPRDYYDRNGSICIDMFNIVLFYFFVLTPS